METNHEEHHKKSKNKSNEWLKIFAAATIVFLACGISFAAGMQYQKHNQPTIRAGLNDRFSDGQGEYGMGQGFRGGGMRQNVAIGTVTAISSTSITVNDQRSGTSTTKTINSTTTITNNGTKVAVDSIKVGDSVFVRASTSDTTIASSIDVNPTMPMGRTQSSNQSIDNSGLQPQTN